MPDGADAPLPSMPLLDAVLGVGADLDLRATLQHIVDSARRLTGAAYGSLGMTAPSQEGPAELFVSGEDEGKYENKGEAKGHRTNDSDNDGDSGDDVVRVPIHVHDEAFGDLLLAGKAEGPFTEEDRQLLRVLASQAGIAIGNARLFEAARQRERWIEGAAAVTTALLTGEAAADALMTVADRARILAGAAAGVILQPTESGGMRIVAASTDGPPPGRPTPTEGHPPRSPASATALTPPHRESPSGTPAQNADPDPDPDPNPDEPATPLPVTGTRTRPTDPTPPTPPDATPTPDPAADGDRDSNGTGAATATGDDLIGTTIEPGSAVLTQLLGGEPVFIEDSATDPRMTTHVRARFGPSMMLPLQAGGRLIGTLALPRRRGAPAYTAAERLLATQFASQAALALVLADAQQSRQRLAVFEDRDRIARDLHDLVVQRLFATGMMLESTRRKAHSPQVESTLGHAVDELESTIQEVRTAIFALQQPPADAPTTFRGKVLRETAGAAAVLGIQPSVHFGGAVDTRITDPAAGHLLAALRRALA
ncbi:GAF domain-containing protein, partial [Streptomyces sp. NPDC005900]|uniref:GAF domain-containing protein n=1 Tax=Streptomyces sp. NPDC005900 TaxID=3154569 RepID=UPI0033C6CC5F